MDDIIKRMQCKLFHFFSCDKFHLKGIKGLLAVVLMGGILVGCSPKIENNQNLKVRETTFASEGYV